MAQATSWKAFTIGAALGALSLLGAGTAAAAIATPPAQTSPAIATSVVSDAPLATDSNGLRPDRSAGAAKTRTSGSTQIYTAPNPNVGRNGSTASVYGPFFNQNRGLGGAAAIGGAAGGR